MAAGLRVGNKVAKHCIVQGGMSVRISLAPLAAAVAKAGGVGTIGAMCLPPEELRKNIREARAQTTGVIGVNIMYAGTAFSDLLQVCIEEAVDYVAIGAGFARGPFKLLDEHGIPGFAIISSVKAASIASRTRGITGIVVESGLAGGHLGPKDPEISTWDLFPAVLEELKRRDFPGPVIAAGGLADRQDVLRALDMGADGVQLGTRFAMTEESSASDAMKKAWQKATGSQVQWWSPTGYASRAIVPHHQGKLPQLSANGTICYQCLKRCVHNAEPTKSHCIRQALLNSWSGDVDHGLMFSGARVGDMEDIPPTTEVMARLTEGS